MAENISYQIDIGNDDATEVVGDYKDSVEESNTTLVSRNITIMGRRTSIRLEPEMWMALKEISNREGCSIHDICSLVSLRKKPKTSLTAAIRVFLMLYFRAAATSEGHQRAGHGDFENMVRRARLCDELAPMSNFKRREVVDSVVYN